MKKYNFKNIFVVFSLCVFLLSLFSVSSFALNISDVNKGYLYKFDSDVSPVESIDDGSINVNGYLVDKKSGNMIPFTSLKYGSMTMTGTPYYYWINAVTASGDVQIIDNVSSSYDLYIDYSTNTVSKSSVDSVFSQYWIYTVTSLNSVDSIFGKANIALMGGTNSEGVSYDGLLGMISKFGKFLVSSPLLLVLCIALPLVSFSVGLIIRIKNRA